jgi:hypothetical protein
MLRSRVLTPGFRLFAGFSVVAFIGAYLFALGGNLANTDQGLIDSVIGPMVLGWKGGVGGHLGYTVLLATSAAAALVAGVVVAFRDADPEAQAEVAHVETMPLTAAPHGASYAPLAMALGGVGLLIGLAASPAVFVVSLFVLLGTAIVWTVRAWSNRATGDPVANHDLYERVMEPWRLPVLAIIAVAFVVLGLSRLLLAVSAVGSVIAFAGVATLFFVGSALVAARPRMPRSVLTLLVLLTALLILAAAIVGLVAGQREFEHEEHHSAHAPAAIGEQS